MRLLLFFLAVCVVAGLRAQQRGDELPRTRWVVVLIVVVSTGYLSRRFI